MNAMDAILSRRSIRKFTDQPIDAETKKLILSAGFAAPSAHNLRPQHFLWLEDREVINKLIGISPYVKMFASCPAVLVVCGDAEVSPMFWTADCAASSQNVLLAAHSLGMGACWCAAADAPFADEVAEAIGAPANLKAYSMIALGHTEVKKEGKDRYDEARVHNDKF